MTVATTTGAAIRARIADLIDDGGPADVAFAERLVASFLERQSGLLGHVADAIAEADAEGTARRAHALKGAAGNIGATAVAALCAEAEKLAAAQRWDQLASYPDRLRSALAEAAGELTLALADLRTHERPEG